MLHSLHRIVHYIPKKALRQSSSKASVVQAEASSLGQLRESLEGRLSEMQEKSREVRHLRTLMLDLERVAYFCDEYCWLFYPHRATSFRAVRLDK